MPLIHEVKRICDRLANHGWKELLLKQGLDITAPELEREFGRELSIDRSVPGFEDFAHEGMRGIEPGNPARSLLYHAFASPNVTGLPNSELTSFPTPREIEIVENYVFGIAPPSLLELRAKAAGHLLALVVFAYEYRPAPETVHRKHADLCFSRTGVSRVGTAELLYDAKRRGFLPFVERNDFAIRILPARYAAFVAVQLKGDNDRFGPMRFKNDKDADLDFWVPIHKLFDGEECIRGLNLQVSYEQHHINEKLRRIHLELKRTGRDTGWDEPDISRHPFVFAEGIANWSSDPEMGTGLLVPAVHSQLVEPAEYNGQKLTFIVPPNNQTLSSSLYIPDDHEFRHAPEYVHVRTKFENDKAEDLNEKQDVLDIIRRGGYRALHYVDYTGDGWVKVSCPSLAVEIPRNIPAYSLVTAPDFFPNCDQRELMDWWEQSVPSSLKDIIWKIAPNTLSDERMAPNLQLKAADFRAEDKTATAIVSLLTNGDAKLTALNVPETTRHAYLPDAASGVFAPGWDVTHDRDSSGTEHLAAYGLGSPFPEDAKLCAALSTFWPAVAPDAARTFQPNATGGPWPTVSPLTDEELGVTGGLPWDGIIGPRLLDDKTVEYVEFDHADYTINAVKNKFSLALTGRVDIAEYKRRLLSMARVYKLLGSTSENERASWAVLSFKQLAIADSEVQDAQEKTQTTLNIPAYRFLLYRHGDWRKDPANPHKIRVAIMQDVVTLLVDSERILYRYGSGQWQRKDV